jgi:Spy/CpxP family protein refolding chaperone
MKKQILLALGVAVSTGLAFAATQDPGSAGRPPRPRRPMDPTTLRQELGLSEQQVGELQKLRLDARKSAIRRHADTRLARLNLREALQSTSVDEKAVGARTRELSELQAANVRARVDARLALRKILSAEQQQKLKELRPQRPPRPGRRGDEGDDREAAAERAALTRPDVR